MFAQLPRPSASRLAVRVTPDALRQIRGGHPWVYEASITSVKGPSLNGTGASGDLAVVFDDDRNFVAIGLYDPASPIRVKLVHRGKPTAIDRAFWTQQFLAAQERRRSLIDRGDTTGYRLVHGENDSMPGLVLDRYSDTLVLKLYSAMWLPHLADVVPAIADAFHPEALVLRLARNMHGAPLHGLEEGDALIGVSPADPILFTECGLTFEADVVRGQKTGHFLDQRDNRALIGTNADDCRVLDMFANTGGFSVHAAAGGAREVVAVDSSAPALAAASRNMAHNLTRNEVAACAFRTETGDAFEVMDRYARKGERFEIVIVDPPSFTPRQTSVEKALQSYTMLAERAVKLVRPDGLLLLASCSSRVTADEFHITVSHAAARAGRPLDELRRTGHAIDHPVGFAQGAYLKAVLARVP
ncbi:MAG: class I SAM-dependent rRNA methyltransferase [Actinomycetia bacterium]|nr:class I SAM-dependent rRNA methyltransferase [Actinomycetes bacterium]